MTKKFSQAVALTMSSLLLLSLGANVTHADEPGWREDFTLAMNMARDGNANDALPVLKRLHRQYPQNTEVTQNYIAVLDWAGQEDAAIALYKDLPAGSYEDYVYAAIGHAYRAMNKGDKALAVYREGLKHYPGNTVLATGAARCLMEAGRYADAVQVGANALTKSDQPQELNSIVDEARHVNAVELARAGKYDEALSIMGVLRAKYPDDAKLTRDNVAILSWAGQDQAAVDLYKTLPEGDQPDYVYAAVGLSMRNLHQANDAAAVYAAALKQYPDSSDFAVAQIRSLIEADRTDEAVDAAQKAIEKHQDNPQPFIEALSYAEQQKAAELSRTGHFERALKILRDLNAKFPNNRSVKYDLIAVLAWNNKQTEAINMYGKLSAKDKAEAPDFVSLGIANAYRNQKMMQQALALYTKGAQSKSKRKAQFIAGQIRCLIDMNHFKEANKIGIASINKYPSNFDIQLAASDAAYADGQAFAAMTDAHRALAIRPNDKDANRALIRAEDRLGATQSAKERADQTKALSYSEYQEVEGDSSASLVRWGKLEPNSEATRYAEADKAIANLDQIIAKKNPALPADHLAIQRARFDRIVALRDRFRMQEVVNEYEGLVASGAEIPPYIMGPVGDAYLYLRQPEKARDVYLQALAINPNDFEVRRQLFFAYVECNDFDNAYATIDKLNEDQPIWFYLKGEPERQPNPNRAMTEIDAANARLYAGELADADERITKIAEAAPNDAPNRDALGNIYLTRGWPHAAAEEFKAGMAIQGGHDIYNETGLALADLDMRNYRAAETRINELLAAAPENLDVLRLKRQWDVYNMAELDIDADYKLRSAGNAQGGNEYGVDLLLYSAPIDYNWRIFAGTNYAHEEEPSGEGTIGYSRSLMGIEYRGEQLQADLAPTYNRYKGTDRVGVDAKGEWAFDDYWAAGGEYELFSHDTPVRALNSGVTANAYKGNVQYRGNEAQEVNFNFTAMDFSDGNFRTAESLAAEQGIFTTPYFRLSAVFDGGFSQNSADNLRNYYNPKSDVVAMAGPRLTQTLYRRYETLWEHSLQIVGGDYWERGYSAHHTWDARYDHTISLNDTTQLRGGVEFNRQTYDGVFENSVSFHIGLVERF